MDHVAIHVEIRVESNHTRSITKIFLSFSVPLNDEQKKSRTKSKRRSNSLTFGCFQKIVKHPKMDGENNENTPIEQMDDLGGKNPTIFGNTPPEAASGPHRVPQI